MLPQTAAPPPHTGCFFPIELQGTYVTQQTSSIIPAAFSTAEAAAAASQAAHAASAAGAPVHYSVVNITADAIPIWGQCHRRIGNDVILRIDSDASECYRCLQLRLLARNVLRVRTDDSEYISKCYTNEGKAMATCPGLQLPTAATPRETAAGGRRRRRRRRSAWMDGAEYDANEFEYSDDEYDETEGADDMSETSGEKIEILLYSEYKYISIHN